MFNLLKAGANVIAQAAQEVAEEINQAANAPNPNFVRGTGVTTSKQDGEAVCLGSEGRLVLCGFPDKNLSDEVYREDRSLKPFSSPAKLREFLTNKFPEPSSEVLVWNLSGRKYAYEDLKGNIIEYDFPSRPILPFDALVEVATAINSWLSSSPNNIAVVHDISGRRAAVVAACALEFTDYYPRETSLRCVATEMGKAGNALVGSQIRYFEYFCISRRPNSVYKRDRRLSLERVIVNGIPDFSGESKLAPSPELGFCFPFVKVIDASGKELDCSVPPLKPVFGRDISINLHPTKKLILSGDIMLRFFHCKPDSTELAMFAVSFHVGFVTDAVLRFNINEIDGTAKNPRFPRDMFIDVILSENLTERPFEVQEKPTRQLNIKSPTTTEETEDDFSRSALIRELEAIDDAAILAEDDDVESEGVVVNPSPTSITSPGPEPKADSKEITSVPTPSVSLMSISASAEGPKPQAEMKDIANDSSIARSSKPNSGAISPEAFAGEKTNDSSDKYTLNSSPVAAKTPLVTKTESKTFDSLASNKQVVPPSPINFDRGDSVLKEIEAALEEEDFAVEDFDISELDEEN